MSDTRIKLLVEDDLHGQVMSGLGAAGLLPGDIEVSRQPVGGDTKLVSAARPTLEAGGRVLLLRDLDVRPSGDTGAWLAAELGRIMPQAVQAASGSGALPVIRLSAGAFEGRVAAVAAGLPSDATLRNAWGLETFSADDYLLRLAGIADVYEALPDCRKVPHDLAMKKLAEFSGVLVRNGLPMPAAKQLLLYLRGVTRYEIAPGFFARSLLDAAASVRGAGQLRALFEPLVSDIHAAVAGLRGV